MEIHNKIYFYKELFSKFLLRNPEIPICQRSPMNERVNHFYNKVIKNNYIGIINCAMLTKPIEKKYNIYIVDGQHRYLAYKKYYDNNEKDFYINYIVNICTTKEEVTQYFKDLNDNYNLESLILDDFDKAEMLKIHIKNKYPKHISASENPIFPNVNIDMLTKYMIYQFKDSKDIVKAFEELNDSVKNSIQNLENENKYKNQKQGLCLGYLFIKTENEIKRKRIPASVRHSIWNREFNESTNGKCGVCSLPIQINNFHAGHIISIKNGGSDSINNLMPVCPCCNLSMSSINLLDFKNKYYLIE